MNLPGYFRPIHTRTTLQDIDIHFAARLFVVLSQSAFAVIFYMKAGSFGSFVLALTYFEGFCSLIVLLVGNFEKTLDFVLDICDHPELQSVWQHRCYCSGSTANFDSRWDWEDGRSEFAEEVEHTAAQTAMGS